MAPVRQTKHSRSIRSAKDPRGIYAPSATSFAPADDTQSAPSTTHPSAVTDINDDFSSFKTTKKDKRGIRHETLLAKARASSRKGGAAGRVVKRRRAGRKLKVDMGGLGDALPEAGVDGGDGEGEVDEWVGLSDDEDEEMNGDVPAGLRKVRKKKPRRVDGGGAGVGKMVMKSLRHRPGAMKRKGVMEERERERFGRNLAGMVGRVAPSSAAGGNGVGAGKAGEGVQQAEKWAALRRFIGGTMERSAAFGGEKT
ncbi:hypothetical protein LTR86_009651 [Recurvomyces mirabilis]|nr:hypothetical protein LTR86_009651 [Recurvomyces mirabilis]